MGLVTLNEVKTYLGIGGITYPAVTVDLEIDTVAGTITRSTGNWNTSAGVAVGSLLTLAGFTNVENNVQIAVKSIDSNTVIKYLGPIDMVDETGVGTSYNPADPANDTTYDTFLTTQIEVISEAIEGFCGRKFLEDTYTQIFTLEKDYQYLFHYPLTEITTIKTTEDNAAVTDYTVVKPLALLRKLPVGVEIEVEYKAGFVTLPYTIQHVLYSLIEEKYNKKVTGVGINFGSDVQRMSIPGTISIDFDYSLTTNDRKNAFGNILGNYMNNLDPYRSERVLVGTIRGDYVE